MMPYGKDYTCTHGEPPGWCDHCPEFTHSTEVDKLVEETFGAAPPDIWTASRLLNQTPNPINAQQPIEPLEKWPAESRPQPRWLSRDTRHAQPTQLPKRVQRPQGEGYDYVLDL